MTQQTKRVISFSFTINRCSSVYYLTTPQFSPGLGAVGTLRTGYPRVQASSQDNGSRLPAEGSSEVATCPRGSGQLRGRHVSPRLGLSLPAEGSSGAATCPHGSGSCSRLWAALGTPTCPRGSGSRSQLGAAPGPPRVPAARAPVPGSGQLRRRHVSPWLGLPLPARGSFGAATCPRALRAAGK
jgi:hypothetical protein